MKTMYKARGVHFATFAWRKNMYTHRQRTRPLVEWAGKTGESVFSPAGEGEHLQALEHSHREVLPVSEGPAS